MRAAVLTIGDELICGARLDTNSQTIARRLALVPLDVVLHLSVGDNLNDIQIALGTAMEMAQILIITGGLGPTEDDLTRQAVAAFFGRPLVEDAEALERIRERYARRGRPMPERNRIQAQIPAGSEIIHNDRGTAASFYLQVSECHLFVIPGVPYEMEGMLQDFILPRLQDLAGRGRFVVRREIKLFGPTESEAAQRMEHMMGRNRNPLLGLLPHRGTITVEVVAQGETAEEARSLLSQDVARLWEIFGQEVLSADERELPQVVVDLLSEHGLALAVVESLRGTAGLVAARLGEASERGSGFRHGRVVDTDSEAATVEAWAGDIRRLAGVEVGLASGALLWPDDAPAGRPYGMLSAAVDVRGKVTSRQFSYTGERERVREFAAEAALGLLRLALLDGAAARR